MELIIIFSDNINMVYFPVIDIDKSCKTAFGELLVAQNTTLLHLHFDYNLNSEHVVTSVVNTGTVTQTSNAALLQTGTTTSSSGKLLSKRYASYSPGMGIDCRFTARWNIASTAGGFSIVGLGDADSVASIKPRDGYFIGFDFQTTATSNFHVFRYQDNNQTSINQTSFNGDKLDGTGKTGINIAVSSSSNRLNVFRIVFQWLSAGSIQFQIEDPNTGLFVTFHEIQYANSSSTVSSNNPSFRFYAITSNLLLAQNCLINIPCATIMMQGKEWLTTGLLFSRSNSKTLTTETNIITIRNKTTYQARTNRTVVKIKTLSFSSDGTKGFIFRGYINTTLGGVPSYTDISTNTSVCDFDTAGTTVTGGRQVCAFAISKTDNNAIDIDNLDLYIYPGDIFTFSAVTASSGDAFVSLTWIEDS